MISPLRRKHQTTVRKHQTAAFRTNGALAVVAPLVVALIFCCSTVAQEPHVDPGSEGFTPPVHIPPRIPRFDPGLPETLNGKFNSTQMIRSNAGTGLKSVISDLTTPAKNGMFSSRTRTQPQTTKARTYNQSAAIAPKRRKGIQDRISEMLTSGPQTKSQQPPVRVQNWPGSQQQARQIPRSPSSEYRTMQSAPTTAQTTPAPRMMNRSLMGNVNPTRQHSMVPHQRIPEKRTVQYGRVAPPMTRPVRNRNAIQQVGLRQADDQDNSFIANAQGQFDPQTANDPAPDPKQAAIQFRQSMLNTKTQSQLPELQQRPVSVLKNQSNDNITLEPLDDSFEQAMELRSESPFEELDGYSSPALPNNSLRAMESNFSFQDEVEEQSDDDETDLSIDDSENPLDRSCEDFRQQLLNDSLTDISLDISPPGNPDLYGENAVRVWRDQFGNELVRGSIADLRRGYVVIDSVHGGQVRIPYARLSDGDWLAISDYWRLPIECGLGAGNYVARCWVPQTVTWHASGLCHKPLYFENRQLERYGHTHGPFLQPVASTAHFFSSLFFLPYNTAINPPNECQYALGFYRPGNCAPWLKDPFPISLAGATRQATVWTGIGFLAD